MAVIAQNGRFGGTASELKRDGRRVMRFMVGRDTGGAGCISFSTALRLGYCLGSLYHGIGSKAYWGIFGVSFLPFSLRVCDDTLCFGIALIG